MIKRIIGILASLGVLALVVLTAIESGSYTSILPDMNQQIETDATTESPKSKPAKSEKNQSVESSDSLKNAKKQ